LEGFYIYWGRSQILQGQEFQSKLKKEAYSPHSRRSWSSLPAAHRRPFQLTSGVVGDGVCSCRRDSADVHYNGRLRSIELGFCSLILSSLAFFWNRYLMLELGDSSFVPLCCTKSHRVLSCPTWSCHFH